MTTERDAPERVVSLEESEVSVQQSILEERKRSLDKEELERTSQMPLIYRVDPFSRGEKLSHFDSTMVSLGLFKRRKWNNFHDASEKREFLKLDVAIKFLADIKKEPSDGWREVREDIVEDPMAMKKLYDEISHLNEDNLEFIRSVLALDAIFVTSFIIVSSSRDRVQSALKSLGSELKQSSKFFDKESRNFFAELRCDILRMENQIPLVLIQNTIKIIFASFPDRHFGEYKADQFFELLCCHVGFRRASRFPLTPSWYNVFRAFGEANEWGEEMDFNFLVQGVEKWVPRQDLKFHKCHHLLHCSAQFIWNESQAGLESRRVTIPVLGSSSISKCLIRFNITLSFFLISWTMRGVRYAFEVSCCGGQFNTSCRRSEVPLRIWKFFGKDVDSQLIQDIELVSIGLVTATELNKGGITLKAHAGADFYPKLVPGRFIWWRATLFLPRIFFVDEYTDQYWKNFLAYERAYFGSYTWGIFLSYVTFMNGLIDTKEDVSLLCGGKNPVIGNPCLGDYQEVANLFNSMSKHHYNTMNDTWREISDGIMWYHNWSHRVKIVEFIDTRFSRPWLVLSVTAAIVVLILGALSTVYTILGYYSK